MTYNQKVWLGILLLCGLFWLTVITSLFSLGGDLGRSDLGYQDSDLAALHGQRHHGGHMLHSVQTLGPRSPL
ncbi:Uncharacterised protein [Serratia entomophila]|jgi:hypothetical protein|uniref:Uncharacterized protein n=1 Tax=Serratia entomophila TaxID=42906 RepID=A0ABY5CP84_9GAMM|nr:hypothetical protein [Serratia entomophila]UIW16947.1 hypothetical protein KHA73_16070 [Serratia entomophila]USU99504.1 hypothetical protein KFQ06_15760 [Serratia entomophila]CAI0702464.1 Uncharacterised protein [Serratia entomophila]CAI0703114.1 Uncharacterised protein [Serratia entomophila]CAI0703601.1 Uncharacterised protein [Serratia entomophila]